MSVAGSQTTSFCESQQVSPQHACFAGQQWPPQHAEPGLQQSVPQTTGALLGHGVQVPRLQRCPFLQHLPLQQAPAQHLPLQQEACFALLQQRPSQQNSDGLQQDTVVFPLQTVSPLAQHSSISGSAQVPPGSQHTLPQQGAFGAQQLSPHTLSGEHGQSTSQHPLSPQGPILQSRPGSQQVG